jgi:nucleotide-binding universal stress UspA family protein
VTPAAQGGGEAPRIVVGVDRSEAATQALRWALGEARRGHATVEVVHAYELAVYAGPSTDGVLEWLRQEAEAVVQATVLAAAGGYPDVPVRQRVVRGPAGPVLVAAAAGAKLLVLGSRGRGPVTGLLLGSVARYCTAHAPCPVIVMRPEPAVPAGSRSG